MKALKYAIVLVLVLLILVAGGLSWLLGTSAGARWLLAILPATPELTVTVRQAEGRLLDHLVLSGVRVVSGKKEVLLDRVKLDWQPLLLFSGALLIEDLDLSGVSIQDNTPLPTKKKPIDLTWPRLPAVLDLFEARIARLKVADLTYRRLQEPPVTVTALSAALSWRYTLLLVSDLKALAPSGLMQGEIVAGLKRPSLRLDLIVVPVKPVAQLEGVSVRARLSPATAPEQVAGNIRISGTRGKARVVSVAGEVGITRNAVNLHQVLVTRDGQRGSVEVDGAVDLSRPEPRVALKVKGSDLDLGPQLHHTTDLAGTITVVGDLERYRGHFSLANRGRGWQAASVSGAYQGGRNAVRFAPFAARVMGGRVNGAVDLAWSPLLTVRANLSGRGIDPAVVAPGWQGAVNFQAAGNLAWSRKGGAAWNVKGRLLESRLKGKTLSGEVDARSAGGDVAVRQLFVRGEGVELAAHGLLSQRISLAATVSDLSLLAPGARGEATGEGWLHYRASRFAGALSGSGRDLAFDGISLGEGSYAAEVSDAPGYPLKLSADLARLSFGSIQAQSATLSVAGTLGSHQGHMELCGAGSELRLALAGGYREGRWRGAITDFSGQDRVGPWSLAAPAAVSAGTDGFSLAPLMLKGVGGESFCLSASLAKPLKGDLDATWGSLNLARANSWVEQGDIVGSTNGKVQLHLLPQQKVDLKGRVELEGSFTTEGHRIELSRSFLTVDADQRGQSAQLELNLLQGAVRARFSSPVPARLALPREGVLAAQWNALDLRSITDWLPAGLNLEGRVSGELTGRLLPGERVDLKGSTSLDGGLIRWHSGDQEAYAALERSEAALSWQGGLSREGAKKAQFSIALRSAGAGSFAKGERRLTVLHALVTLDADAKGSRALVEVVPQGRGSLTATFSSNEPVTLALPESGEFQARLADLDPALIQPWLPGAVNLQGDLSGQVTGRLLPGQRLEAQGGVLFSQGAARWQGQGGELKANLRSAAVSFGWRGEELTGTLSLSLTGSGEARGEFRVPLPARLPVAVNPTGPVSATLTGKLEERGILSAFLPGMVHESHGDLDLDLKVSGPWQDARVQGSLKLANGGGYLPPLGIQVTDLVLAVRLDQNAIHVDTLRARSGPGQIEATAVAELNGWQLRRYQGTITGDRFQTFHLPELEVSSSPQLAFEGDAHRLVLRGQVILPEMRILGPPARSAIGPSRDVIIEGAPSAEERAFPLALDVRVGVVLGDKVLVKTQGIDAQLGGGIEIYFSSLEKINSTGEIKVVKGRYKAYGLDLDIVRGRIYYAGGPVDEPTLDILALRTIGDVKAGVTVGGILREPVVKLYSEPAMPDVDILAYMVLGHPLGGSSSEQGSLVAQAAGVLFSTGQSSSVQEQIKSRLGLSTLEFQQASPETTGRMGYKEIAVTPTGAPSKAAPISQSMLTVGKYLTPKLYFSYGRSLFTGSNLFMLRYDVFKHWQIESQTGTESGMDIYYKIEFK